MSKILGICRKCKKAITSKTYLEGRRVCKDCRSNYRLTWRKNHPERDRLAVRKYLDKIRFGMERKSILEAYNFKCQQCKQEYDDLIIHHIDGKGRICSKPNNKINNLTILCHSCHSKIHSLKIPRNNLGRFTKNGG
jgi:uncharacterized CHY-type Zn-finger protein